MTVTNAHDGTRTPAASRRPIAHDTRRRLALLVAPAAVLGSMYLVFLAASRLVPAEYAVFAGLPFYWLVWCLLFPLWVVGRKGLARMFAPSPHPLGRPAALGLLFLVLPVFMTVSYTAAILLDGGLPTVPLAAVAIAATIALCNGTGEEILWRGTYCVGHRGALVPGYLFPAVGFAFWHLAALPFSEHDLPGGLSFYVLGGLALGLMWGWVTRRSGSIRGAVVSHVTLNFFSQLVVWAVYLS
jgi:membrane protease YdiL (CAAX protease family)